MVEASTRHDPMMSTGSPRRCWLLTYCQCTKNAKLECWRWFTLIYYTMFYVLVPTFPHRLEEVDSALRLDFPPTFECYRDYKRLCIYTFNR